MKFYKVGYYQYRVTANIANKEMLIATISTPLFGMDTVYLNMYFPYEDCSEIKIDISKMVQSELLEMTCRIIMKKMYKMQQDILKDIQFVEFDYKKYDGAYSVCDNFSKGKVYATE